GGASSPMAQASGAVFVAPPFAVVSGTGFAGDSAADSATSTTFASVGAGEVGVGAAGVGDGDLTSAGAGPMGTDILTPTPTMDMTPGGPLPTLTPTMILPLLPTRIPTTGPMARRHSAVSLSPTPTHR